MKFGNWELGWSRNVAIGVIWTPDGKVAIFFLGLTLGRYLPVVNPNLEDTMKNSLD